MDERVLAERLITYDTSTSDGLRAAVGFVKGWLEARDVPVTGREFGGLPVVLADVGPADGPCVILHGHVDVVPAHEDQFQPRVEGDRLIGRGAYDMKGALAAMMCAVHDVARNDRVRLRFICVPDEESDDLASRCTDSLVEEGLRANFAITGEPTDLHIGVQAKGVLAARVEVSGTAAHGSTPWLGDNAILKAYDMFRRIETLRFSRESSELFDRPSINIARIVGGDAFNKVPDRCTMDVDIRFLPDQDAAQILAEISALGDDVRILKTFQRSPAQVSRSNPYVRALRDAVSNSLDDEALSIGRDGASDAISFLEAGIPAVEFGPTGGGHHGPEEWVSIDSLARYRRALRDFVVGLPEWLAREHDPARPEPAPLRAVEGGLNG
ncbi:MAG TPA: M20/M25/M40 family metallo-hydrolase [Solirubrobacteraceae bacterium]|nr:M20/M25/M40 family metallo-hydrolase [Solirubrobacteraceae bacterium]